MKDKPEIVVRLLAIEAFFGWLQTWSVRLHFLKWAEYFDWALMRAIDDLLPWHTCDHCGNWYRDDEQMMELCAECRHPGDCPKCGSDDYRIGWFFNTENTIAYMVRCMECDHQVPADGIDSLKKLFSILEA